jgi:hypothetical protein
VNLRVLTFNGSKENFDIYLRMIDMVCELNPGITIGEFAWRKGAGHVV